MNNELLENMNKLKELYKAYRNELVERYNSIDDVHEKNKIVKEVKELDAEYVELLRAIKNNNVEKLMELENKYEAVLGLNDEYETSEEDKEFLRKFYTGAAVVLGILGIGVGLSSCENEKTAEYQETQEEKRDRFDEKKEKPFAEYRKLTNVLNNKQVQNRATWYFNTYVKQNDGINMIDENGIEDIIRMTNGEFINGSYNGNDIIDIANDIHTISNYSSFAKYGNNVKFIPYAPLFEDGTLAQEGAIMLDASMKNIVKAINENNKEDFLKYAKEWGTTMVNIFEYNDFNGKYPSVFQMDSYRAYQLYQVMYANYGSTILEYSLRNNINICIPYCVDHNSKEVREVPLSEIIYTINEVPTDWVAKRSGHDKEYAENNESLPVELYMSAKNYFDNKYSLEYGKARILK